MQVVNKKILIKEDEKVMCPKCELDITNLRDESHRTYSNWRGESEHRMCSSEEFVICPNCSSKIMLATWDEAF